MIISVANPIYDAVFKYLMEDNRVAKIVLSALLKREVAEVEMRKHEYTNGTRDKISMFRIDFGAKVRQDDGSLSDCCCTIASCSNPGTDCDRLCRFWAMPTSSSRTSLR